MPATAETPQNDDRSTGLAYGYIRMEEPGEIEIALLCKEIGQYCAANGLRLGAVFVDRGIKADVTARLGFTALLDVLCFPDSVGVVVPSLDHLSTQAGIRRALAAKILGTASRVAIQLGRVLVVAMRRS